MRHSKQPFPEPYTNTETFDLMYGAFDIANRESGRFEDHEVPEAFAQRPVLLSVWALQICTGIVNNGGICAGVIDVPFTLSPAAAWFRENGEPGIANRLDQGLALFFGDGPIPLDADERSNLVSDPDDGEHDANTVRLIDEIDDALIARFGNDEPYWRVLAWQVLDHPEQFPPDALEKAVRRNESLSGD